MLKILAHNFGFSVGKTTYFLNVNQFADSTPEELAKIYIREDSLNKIKSNSKFKEECSSEMSQSLESCYSSKKNILRLEEKLLSDKFNSSVDTDKSEESENNSDEVASTNEICQTVESDESHQDSFSDGTMQSLELQTTTDDVPVEDESSNPLSIKEHNETFNELQVDSRLRENEDENNRMYFDWRDSGCLFIPRFQGLCGGCYAFAAVALLEWAHCRQTGKLTPFSEQYMIDCGKNVDMGGCMGGDARNVGRFIMDWGVELREKYPYLGKESSCPYGRDDWDQAGYKKPSINRYTAAHNIKLWPEILEKSGPILVSVRIPEDFFFYGGKVHEGNNCIMVEGNLVHAMVLVGHGIEDGNEFWLLRNSHGPSWGDRGYFKLSKYAKINCFYSIDEAKFDFNSESEHSTETFDETNHKKLRPSEVLLESLKSGKGPDDIVVFWKVNS